MLLRRLLLSRPCSRAGLKPFAEGMLAPGAGLQGSWFSSQGEGKKEEQGAQGPAGQEAQREGGSSKSAGAASQPAAEQPQAEGSAGAKPDEEAGPGATEFSGRTSPEMQQYLDSLSQLKGSTKVQRQTLGAESRPWWHQLIITMFQNWLQKWVGEVIQARVEQEFVMAEWLEGAKDAYWIVHKLLSEEDYETLKNGMVSAKLLEALLGTKADYQRAGFSWRTELEGEVEAGLRGLSFWSKAQMQRYDPARAAEAPDDPPKARPSGMWLVLTVQMRAKQHVTVAREEDGTLAADLIDFRPQTWTFANGPLPEGLPVRRLETDWFLVTI